VSETFPLLERIRELIAKRDAVVAKRTLADRLRTVAVPPTPPAPQAFLSWKERVTQNAQKAQLVKDKRGEMVWSSGVKRTADFKRILNLPRRAIESFNLDMTELYRRPGGTMTLRFIQSAALYEAPRVGGLIGPIAVGGGKTIILLLLPRAFNAKRPILLVKPDLKDQLVKVDWPNYGKHFVLPDNAMIVTYSQLSTAGGADILDRVQPDLIVADEVHCLKNKDAARTKRFLRYMKAHPETRFCGLSGSITNRSVRDFAHLSELALREGSPLPLTWSDLEEWALALDPVPEGMPEPPPGALLDFCAPGENAREGFRRRLAETPGVIASGDAGEGMSLRVRGITDVEIPAVVQEALAELRKKWVTPDGEELEDVMALARSAKQLSQGFYYIWDWPDGKVDEEWLEARRQWHRAIREVLKHRSRPGLDSPLFVARAAARGELRPDEIQAYEAWAAVKHRPKPPTIPVWISDFLLLDVPNRIQKGVIWYQHTAVGRRAAELLDLPLFEGGDDSAKILSTKAPLIIASINAHKEGKNLQRYHHGLVLSTPSDGITWQQMLGRMHRSGQLADEVIFDVYQHDESQRYCLSKAYSEAIYRVESQVTNEKLILASKENLDLNVKIT
jgi:hypothetical protein